MILTTCAACAAPLAHDAPRCVRCKIRYCDSTCQHDHWRRGHKQMCKKIHRGGNAEQYNADKKYKEAVAVAVEACAKDTKGQTCYICTQALHWKTKEGLVRMCACRGTAGFAHVSCLAEQAKILVAEVEENNLGDKAMDVRFARWYSCSLCEQQYHGVVGCALGWACWKTYLGRPETDTARKLAMNLLGNSLAIANHHVDALTVKEAELSMHQRVGGPEEHILATRSNLAMTYRALGREEEALHLRREVYSGRLKLNGEEHEETLRAAFNYANSLLSLQRYAEAKALLRKTMPVARRVLGEGNRLTLKMRWTYAKALYKDNRATLDDLREAVSTLEDAERTARQVLGGVHPTTGEIERALRDARAALQAATEK
ncbi:unnamed protein product [Pelagomonas calceolata]|uniref:MYND-type domain-containing protein n=1 Tax=Pelagomonas calceolata TaxID=35677 RepID=A0A8J2SSA1_9STRA|nr:unnamed protein product [Pelagomonas calceolata]